MRYTFNYDELSVLQKIFDEMDTNVLSNEESDKIKKFQNEVFQTIKEHDEMVIQMQAAQLDFEEQCRTNNFKYLCDACKNGMRPRCLDLRQDKYCASIFGGTSCKARIDNPKYKA